MSRLFFLLFLLPLSACAGESTDLAKIKQNLQAQFGESKVESIKKTPIAGIYELSVDGSLVYSTADGHYQLQGDIIDRTTGKNLTKLSLLTQLTDDNTIVFKGANPKYTLNVFTDTDCGYCRKLHTEVPELIKEGVKVRYALFPRAGLYSQSARTMESVWCSDNRQEAMNAAKSGAAVEEKHCDNPIQQHYSLARSLGLQGTPFLITGNGTIIPGYRPASDLLTILKADTVK